MRKKESFLLFFITFCINQEEKIFEKQNVNIREELNHVIQKKSETRDLLIKKNNGFSFFPVVFLGLLFLFFCFVVEIINYYDKRAGEEKEELENKLQEITNYITKLEKKEKKASIFIYAHKQKIQNPTKRLAVLQMVNEEKEEEIRKKRSNTKKTLQQKKEIKEKIREIQTNIKKEKVKKQIKEDRFYACGVAEKEFIQDLKKNSQNKEIDLIKINSCNFISNYSDTIDQSCFYIDLENELEILIYWIDFSKEKIFVIKIEDFLALENNLPIEGEKFFLKQNIKNSAIFQIIYSLIDKERSRIETKDIATVLYVISYDVKKNIISSSLLFKSYSEVTICKGKNKNFFNSWLRRRKEKYLHIHDSFLILLNYYLKCFTLLYMQKFKLDMNIYHLYFDENLVLYIKKGAIEKVKRKISETVLLEKLQEFRKVDIFCYTWTNAYTGDKVNLYTESIKLIDIPNNNGKRVYFSESKRYMIQFFTKILNVCNNEQKPERIDSPDSYLEAQHKKLILQSMESLEKQNLLQFNPNQEEQKINPFSKIFLENFFLTNQQAEELLLKKYNQYL